MLDRVVNLLLYNIKQLQMIGLSPEPGLESKIRSESPTGSLLKGSQVFDSPAYLPSTRGTQAKRGEDGGGGVRH